MERWTDANWTYLHGEMARVTAALERAATNQLFEPAVPTTIPAVLVEKPPAIVNVAREFGLSTFEREVVLACAAAELDPGFAKRTGFVRPVMRQLLNAFAGVEHAALDPGGRLRSHRLVTPVEGVPLFMSPLTLDEAVLHTLLGSVALDARLANVMQELTTGRAHSDLVELVSNARTRMPSLLVGLFGSSEDERQSAAAAVSNAFGLRAFRLRGADLPMDSAGRTLLRDRWERERRLHPFAMLVELGRDANPEVVRAAQTLLVDLGGLTFLSSDQPVWISRASYVSWELPAVPREQRRANLERALGPHDENLKPVLDRIATQFTLTGDATERAVLAARAHRGDLGERLWEAARTQARPRLDDVARRLETRATWDDLVLPAPTMLELRALSSHIRHQTQVFERWGFAGPTRRGLGAGALFAGQSGTGKTLAAEVLAHEARLDLYHIDLSQVVNKFVGETEKNLRRVFDAAEDSGAILLFDEADSLFGKRGEVDKGTDRYANLEVSYLLQRMEQYRGIAILTTNQRDAIDAAFLRRLRFLINFRFPDTAERIGIWHRAFPVTAPTHGIDVAKLARLKLPGGNIRSIALNAAFLAADAGEPISMRHLLTASRAEFAKIERPFPEADGW